MEEPFQPYSDSLQVFVILLYLLLPYGGTISTIFGFFTVFVILLQPKSTVELGYMCPRGLLGPPAVTLTK